MKGEVFLSASVPVPGRGDYFSTADPFLIQAAVRELVIHLMGRKTLVWGGHPAITPMIWSVCEDLDIGYANSVILYQSSFFEDIFPMENQQFANVIYTQAVPGDLRASLQIMREAMLSRSSLQSAVFIGGMEGIFEEHAMFKAFHPDGSIIPMKATGGACAELNPIPETDLQFNSIDFADIYNATLKFD
ncbi:MAG: hypothetical protein CBB60_010100 [Armatimonadetes bacterium Cent15-Ar3]|nr:MAG: hypothetical protein CBB60_010100 [Armatimonadetes bacterium Cent15-Ar3]